MSSGGLPKSLSPTLLGAQSSGLAPPPSLRRLVSDAATCARCGVLIEKGDRAARHETGTNFTDWMLLAAPESSLVCAGCATLTQSPHVKRITGRFGVGVILSEMGWWRAGKNVEIAYWLLNPPEFDRWVWAQATSKGQHVLWKAPVNLQREMFRIQLGNDCLTVRRAALQDLIEATAEFQLASGTKHYPMYWDFEKVPTGCARVQPLAEAIGTPVETLVRSATYGELWALAKLIAAGFKKGELPKPPTPEFLPAPLF